MGLIPIKADPRQFEYRQESEKVDLECTDEKEAHSGKYESSEKDTLKVLFLSVNSCSGSLTGRRTVKMNHKNKVGPSLGWKLNARRAKMKL